MEQPVFYLNMIWRENNPTAEQEARVEAQRTDQEPDHMGKRSLEGQDENLLKIRILLHVPFQARFL